MSLLQQRLLTAELIVDWFNFVLTTLNKYSSRRRLYVIIKQRFLQSSNVKYFWTNIKLSRELLGASLRVIADAKRVEQGLDAPGRNG